MGLLDNMFVKKAVKSMLTDEQFKVMNKFMDAFESGEIDKEKLKKVSDKIAVMETKDINKLLDVIDANT